MFYTGTLLISALLSLSAAPKDFMPMSLMAAHHLAADTVITASDSSSLKPVAENDVIDPANLIAFAQTLKGVPYRYGCSDPEKGFDCSGFVKYVFNHFQMSVPRSSKEFTNVGKEVDLRDAVPGDLILFTGTDSAIRKVGHVGIITQSGDTLAFIHASSGKVYAVTETTLNAHYKKRFIKVVRMLR
jgi:cell wall-associated NlpC family hydrolase